MRQSRFAVVLTGGLVLFGGLASAADEDVVSAAVNAAASTQAEKARQGRLSYQLDQVADAHEQGRALSDRRSLPRWVDADTGRVTAVIELRAGARPEDLSRSVAEVGGTIEGSALDRVKVILPPGGLRAVAADPAVRIMRQPFYAERKVVSQGVKVIKADVYQNKAGDDGTGVTVGVMDVGFLGVNGLVGSELPSDTTGTDWVLRGGFSTEHGTACAEIVHDVAPGAKLVLGGFSGDEVEWATELDRLVNAGVDIITHSVGFDNVEAPNGKGFFAKKADSINSRGVLFVTAAGNEGQRYHQSPWLDKNKNDFLEFKGKTEKLPILVDEGNLVSLRWDDSFGSSNHDNDLYILDNSNNILARSEGLQTGNQNPYEQVSIPAGVSGKVYVAVRHVPGSPLKSNQKFFVYVATPGIVDTAYQTKTTTLTLPGDAKGAVSVGALAYNTKKLEPYSSQGPTSDNRPKPDVMGPDRVATVSFGSSFPGTSAATPHAAGAAALILSHNPGMSVSALRSALQKATTSGGNSRNNQQGYGLLDLSKAN